MFDGGERLTDPEQHRCLINLKFAPRFQKQILKTAKKLKDPGEVHLLQPSDCCSLPSPQELPESPGREQCPAAVIRRLPVIDPPPETASLSKCNLSSCLLVHCSLSLTLYTPSSHREKNLSDVVQVHSVCFTYLKQYWSFRFPGDFFMFPGSQGLWAGVSFIHLKPESHIWSNRTSGITLTLGTSDTHLPFPVDGSL